MAIEKKELEAVNKKLATIDVKGKAYVQVNERIKAFRELVPSGCITTDILSIENGIVTMQAKVLDENGMLLATGLAQEKETSSYINKTSYIENCETSAVGRALGFLGIGVDGSMASAEEVANAIINQNKPTRGRQETPEEAKKNDEMRAGVDPVYLPTTDGKVSDAQWAKLNAEMERTGITVATLKKMYEVSKLEDMTEAQVVAALNKFKATKDK